MKQSSHRNHFQTKQFSIGKVAKPHNQLKPTGPTEILCENTRNNDRCDCTVKLISYAYQKAVRVWKLMVSSTCSGALSSSRSMMKILWYGSCWNSVCLTSWSWINTPTTMPRTCTMTRRAALSFFWRSWLKSPHLTIVSIQTLLSRLILVTVLVASPECLTRSAMSRTKASRLW